MKKNDPKFHYLYCPLFTSDEDIVKWKDEKINYLSENNFTFMLSVNFPLIRKKTFYIIFFLYFVRIALFEIRPDLL